MRNPSGHAKSLTTLLLTADRDLEDGTSVSPPIHQSVNFRIKDAAHLSEISVPMGDRYYARRGNPTLSRLARVIADLEGAETGIVTASGMGALATAALSLVRSGDHVCRCVRAGHSPNTRLILLKTPVNPLMHITDLQEVARLAKPRGITTLCDNTFATPINQRPIELGVDLVMHSVTKYIGGHHDLLTGAIVGGRELVEKVWDLSLTLGAIAAPFNAWLALRGIRTLEPRLQRHNANGTAIAERLSGHPAVSQVHYPGWTTSLRRSDDTTAFFRLQKSTSTRASMLVLWGASAGTSGRSKAA